MPRKEASYHYQLEILQCIARGEAYEWLRTLPYEVDWVVVNAREECGEKELKKELSYCSDRKFIAACMGG